MNIVLSRQALANFALFEEKENGAIALGVCYAEDQPLRAVILQITEDPHGQPGGMYVEIDGHGFEDGVLGLHYDESAGYMRLVLAPEKHPPLTGLQLTMPRTLTPEQLELLQRLIAAQLRCQLAAT